MRATGIVRRIDDLGRVVIPKEIRRTMNIREGDPLEIYLDTAEKTVCFKKYNAFCNGEETIKAIISACPKLCFLYDNSEEVFCHNGSKPKEYDEVSSDNGFKIFSIDCEGEHLGELAVAAGLDDAVAEYMCDMIRNIFMND